MALRAIVDGSLSLVPVFLGARLREKFQKLPVQPGRGGQESGRVGAPGPAVHVGTTSRPEATSATCQEVGPRLRCAPTAGRSTDTARPVAATAAGCAATNGGWLVPTRATARLVFADGAIGAPSRNAPAPREAV